MSTKHFNVEINNPLTQTQPHYVMLNINSISNIVRVTTGSPRQCGNGSVYDVNQTYLLLKNYVLNIKHLNTIFLFLKFTLFCILFSPYAFLPHV